MACKTLIGRKKYLAKISDKFAPCAFCDRLVDDETIYGKLYSIGDIYCHYFCVLLSSCLIQKGRDEEGLYGFLYPDIIIEIDRSKKHKCSYCSKGGATLGCSVAQCRKQFHLPCGREKSAVSLFYGNYKTFCRDHAPKQKIPNAIMNKAVLRRRNANKLKQGISISEIKGDDDVDTVCVICYEQVDAFPTLQTFWPPCCARDAWFHRNCIERMALSAGIHYLKCPLCNDKEHFYKSVLEQGYYVPDRDAAWELEQNAYSEIYERPSVCCADECQCPNGREFDAETGPWDIQLCVLCGSAGSHLACGKSRVYVCESCSHASPDMEGLEQIIKVSLPSQNQNSRTRISGPVMPSRMSLRRTKGRNHTLIASTSTKIVCENSDNATSEQTTQENNIKSPKRRLIIDNNDNNRFSTPIKLIEKEIVEKYNTKYIRNLNEVLEEVVEKFKTPRPLVEKRKIVQNVLEDFLMNNLSKEICKSKREWNSPKKSSIEDNIKLEVPDLSVKLELETDFETVNMEQKTPEKSAICNESVLLIQETPKLKKINIQNDSMEISENDEIINVDLVEVKNLDAVMDTEKQKCLKFNPFEGDLEKHTDIDVESFKHQYLNEVDRKCCTNIDNITTKNKELNNCNVMPKTITKKPPKRKLTCSSVASKRGKTTKMVGSKRRKNKTEVSIRNKNINLKIKWKNEELNLKISNLKKRNKRRKNNILKQYVLSPQSDASDIITRPNSDVTLIKPKKIKTERSPDNLKQTCISSFFMKIN